MVRCSSSAFDTGLGRRNIGIFLWAGLMSQTVAFAPLHTSFPGTTAVGVPGTKLQASRMLADRQLLGPAQECFRNAKSGYYPIAPAPAFCQGRRTRASAPADVCMAAGAQGIFNAPGSGHAILCAAGGTAKAVESSTQVLISSILGYGILLGSLFLQVPQLYKILKARSVAGISRWSRYSEVPINSSSCIYHFLIGAPLVTWGENIIVLAQNIAIVITCWLWDKQRVSKREMLTASTALAALSVAQLSLPTPWIPVLIWLNIPFILGSTVPQIVQNFQQGHTGQLAITVCFLKLGGCSVRVFTTITQIGLDAGLLLGYGAGLLMNLTLMIQGIMYREQTAKVLAAEKAQRPA